ncbi:MAG: cobalamin-dependent protein [Chloroflexota bacterium]|nr:cobalamin-dependent protein [Chloroflexota bacterium]
MKILLIATNQADRFMDRMVVRPVPIGLAYLAASVDEERHTLRVLDLMFADDAVSQVADAVSEFEPDLIGLSIRNLDNQSSLNPVWNLPAVRDIIDRIRQISAAKTLVGGPAFSILPSECLDYVGADLGIAGDAAEAFATLVERIDSGADYRDIPGIVYRDDANDGQIVVSEGRFTSNFHRSPRLDLLDMRAYNGSGFGVGVVTKLAQSYYPTPGANYSGDDWRIRDPNEVVDEIRALDDDFGINKVFFIDSGFNIPAEHAKATCRAIIDAGAKVRWNSYIRPSEDADAELMELMKQSGCSLALMAEGGRGGEGLDGRLAGLERMADLCRGAGLPFTMNVTFGEPGETKASVERKLDFLKRVKSVFAVLRVGTRVLPNTAVAQTALAEGQIASESELMRPTFYIEPQVRDWLAGHLREAATDYPRWNLM